MRFHLAQMNVAKMRYSMTDPRMRDFAAAIGVVNALADEDPSFVWRLPSYLEDDHAIRVSGADMLLVSAQPPPGDGGHEVPARPAHRRRAHRQRTPGSAPGR